MTRFRLLFPSILVLTGCAERVVIREVVYVDKPGSTTSNGQRTPPPPRERSETVQGPVAAGLEPVLDAARDHLGKNAVRVNGVSFRYDCSGFVRGIYSTWNIDLMALGPEYPNLNGVGLIFQYLERFGGNHNRRVPSVGNVVYFDNTWDKNNNGKLDDPLTHIGLVEAVDPDGTFYVIHRTNRGIVRDPMNVLRPGDREDESGKPINAYLRPKTRRDTAGTGHLMGELWAGFGHVKPPASYSEAFPETPAFPDFPASSDEASLPFAMLP